MFVSLRRTFPLLFALLLAALLPAQQESLLKQHYDAAYRLQSEGKIPAADSEHTAFLVMALHQMANGYANAGDYEQASRDYDEALALVPENLALRKDYAAAAKDAQDIQKALALLDHAFDSSAEKFPAAIQAQAHRVLGDIQLTLNLNDAAMENYEAAYKLDSSSESLYALGVARLNIQGYEQGAATFAQLLSRFGDTAAAHMALGRAYGQAHMPDHAADEYRKALAKDASTQGAHFGIGAALVNTANPDAKAAQAEFRKELVLDPKDAMSWFELGRLSAENPGSAAEAKEAEADMKRAAELDPRNPDIFIELGKFYVQQKRPQDAEPTFRQAIQVTVDPARNRYAIEPAHFYLGKILYAAGRRDEAAKELAISEEMLDRRRKQEEDGLGGRKMVNSALKKTRVATEEELEQLESFQRSVAPLLAGSYNNLGVHAAMANDFKKAEAGFALAAKWQPELHGVDGNWGRAAFAAGDFAAAIAPLERAVAANPEDAELRSMLEESRQRAGVRAN